MTLDASRCWQCVRTDFGVADAGIGSRQPRRARRYCWIGESGEIRFDEGERVSADGSSLRATDLDGDWDAFDIADEETVMAAAAQWSMNPSTLDERTTFRRAAFWAFSSGYLQPDTRVRSARGSVMIMVWLVKAWILPR